MKSSSTSTPGSVRAVILTTLSGERGRRRGEERERGVEEEGEGRGKRQEGYR